MKSKNNLKLTIDTLFGIFIITLILFVVFSITGFGNIEFEQVGVQSFWIGMISLIQIVTFLIGIWHLRKVANLYVKDSYVSEKSGIYIGRVGFYFLISGGIKIILLVSAWIQNLSQGNISFHFDSETLFTLFLLIIGFFMLIQRKTVLEAKEYQDEINLTI